MTLVSVFTPANRADWLGEAYQSLKDQTLTDWEWVLVPNGGVSLPGDITSDPRVRVVPYPDPWVVMYGHNIGALKRYACDACRGGLLVELDHDDLLTPDALASLAEVRAEHPGAGFFYSDCVGFWPDGRSDAFDARYGWESYPFTHGGTTYQAMRNFPATARSLCEIYYCPNHVRAWTREAYDLTGGHNPTMRVIDDHDLLVRTYLCGIDFVHVPRVLYLYRRHPGSATFTDNPLIQRQQLEVRDRYTTALVMEWCRREGLPLYDLGGAHGRPDGFLSVDREGDPDLKADVLDGPFLDRYSVGCFRACDFLEHLPAGEPVIRVMNDIYDMLAPGGWLLTATPSSDGRGAFCDPTHLSYWNELSFRYYTDRSFARYLNGRVRARYQAVRVNTFYPSEWHEANRLPYVACDLSALKGQRQPGAVFI